MIEYSTIATAQSSNGSLSFSLGQIPVGTFLVTVLRSQSTSASSEFSSPSGWSRTGPPFIPASTGARVVSTYTKFAESSDSNSSVTFNVPNITTGRTVGVILGFTNVDPNTPIVGVSDNYKGNLFEEQPYNIGGGTYTFDTTPVRPLLQLTYGANELVSPHELSAIGLAPSNELISMTATTGTSDTTRSVIVVSGERLPVPGTLAPKERYIAWPAVSGATGHSITLQEAESTPTPFKITLSDGREGSLHHWSGDGASPVKTLTKVHRGFDSVSQMLAKPGFTWAHRGGSANWGEMSLHGYTQSLIQGYGALELSLGRSSDGVWFGHHDETLDRVTETTGNPPISQMTWNQIKQHSITSGADGVSRPFMTVDEFVSSYSNAGVIILDIKYGIQSSAFITEFFEICSRFPKEKVIVKYFYNAVSLADRAASDGYATWGYIYDTDLSDPRLDERVSHWSILGLNWGANQQSWDTVLAFGKPVVGHIAATQEAYNSAMSKGAVGVQCANVLDIKAVGAI